MAEKPQRVQRQGQIGSPEFHLEGLLSTSHYPLPHSTEAMQDFCSVKVVGESVRSSLAWGLVG